MTAAARYPSPLRAIRLKCLDCCLNQPNEVKHCGATACPLHPLRFGRSVPGVRPLTAIVEKCKDCAPDDQPKDCELKTCALWNFRTGHNPNRKGLGMKGGNPANLRKKTRTQARFQERTEPEPSLCTCSTRCAVCACSEGGFHD